MWFARLRRRRRYREIGVMTAELREADVQRAAGVLTDPEYQEYLAGLRARVAEWRARQRRGRYAK